MKLIEFNSTACTTIFALNINVTMITWRRNIVTIGLVTRNWALVITASQLQMHFTCSCYQVWYSKYFTSVSASAVCSNHKSVTEQQNEHDQVQTTAQCQPVHGSF